MSDSSENTHNVEEAIKTNEIIDKTNFNANTCGGAEKGVKKSLQFREDEELSEDQNISSKNLSNQSTETSKTERLNSNDGQEKENIVEQKCQEKPQNENFFSKITESDDNKIEIEESTTVQTDTENQSTESDKTEGLISKDRQNEDRKNVEQKYREDLQNEELVSKIAENVDNKAEEQKSNDQTYQEDTQNDELVLQIVESDDKNAEEQNSNAVRKDQENHLTETDKTEELKNYDRQQESRNDFEQKREEDPQIDYLVSKISENEAEEKSTTAQKDQENHLTETDKTEGLKNYDAKQEVRNDVAQKCQEDPQIDDHVRKISENNKADEKSTTAQKGQEIQLTETNQTEGLQKYDRQQTVRNDVEQKFKEDPQIDDLLSKISQNDKVEEKSTTAQKDQENQSSETGETEWIKNDDRQQEVRDDVEQKCQEVSQIDHHVSKMSENEKAEEKSTTAKKDQEIQLTETDETEGLKNYDRQQEVPNDVEQKCQEVSQIDDHVSKMSENEKGEEKSTTAKKDQEIQFTETDKTEGIKSYDGQTEDRTDVVQKFQGDPQNDDNDNKAKEEVQNQNLTKEAEQKNKNEIKEHDDTNNGNKENEDKKQKSFEIVKSFNALEIVQIKEVSLTEKNSNTELESSESALDEFVEYQTVGENKEQVSIEEKKNKTTVEEIPTTKQQTIEEIIVKPALVEEAKTLEKELVESAIQQNLSEKPPDTEKSSDLQVESTKEQENLKSEAEQQAPEKSLEEKLVLENLTKENQCLKEINQEIAADAENSLTEESKQRERAAEEVTKSILPKEIIEQQEFEKLAHIKESNETKKLDKNSEELVKDDTLENNCTAQVTPQIMTENDNSISVAEKMSEIEKDQEISGETIAAEARSDVVEALIEKKEKTTINKSIDEITAVIEIDDDNDETEANKADEIIKAIKVVEKTTKQIAEPKDDDVIEIDDDDDVAAGEKLNDKEKIKSNEYDDKSKKQDESIETGTTKKKSTSIADDVSKHDLETVNATTIAKMHTMPMIFFKKECINFECPKTHKEYHRAPQFALNYFKISKKKMKVQYICGDCYDTTLGFYQEFCGLLEAKQPILMKCIANKKQEFVEILDSSDEDEDGAADLENKEKENSCFSQADLDLIENELDNTIRNVFERIEIQNQLTWSKTIYTERVKKLQSELEYIDASLGETQKMADKMYNDLYNSGRYRINTLKALDLDNDIEQIPPHGEIERPAIKLGGTYYAARNKAIACWVPCNVLEQVESFLFVPQYRVKFLNAQFQAFKNLSAKLIAYYDSPPVRLLVGQRVIAYFDGTTLTANEKEKSQVKSAFYPGIIAEEMKPNNYYRYLIFYDDGYTQYVSHKDVRLVCHVSRNVWEDVDHVSREFIKKYVQEYRVNRPMVQTHKGQKMATEKNGRWVPARVIDIDCSLVRMQFEGPKGNHTEWIYRGSLRLNPVYMEYQKSKSNQANRTPVSRLPRRTEPFIRYTDDEETINAQQQEQQASRTQNRSNSTSSSQSTPTVRHLNANTIYLEDENKPKGKVIYYTAKRQMPSRVYRPHDCGPHCLIVIPHNLNGYSPLAKPLLSGWERLFSRQKIKKTVYYRAPCGKMFRCMKELHHYLRLTKCSLNVDNFDFYAETSCLAEFEAENVMLRQRDISNGQEKIPLPLINYYDESLPECTYSSKVIPTEGVNISTDPNFLICCDCEDDCVDKTKCACWQLTIEGVKTTNPDAQIDDIGYQYKRLYDHLPTGIYECNTRCKCKSNCLNRVVQHSLGLKLQVFKTSNRGWGLRCLNDIPRGSFVCIYAGNLLTEAKANEGGLDAGDEYFAELDYIETVEQLKEGYESDVETQEDDDEDAYEPEPADDDDFRPSRSVERRVKRGTASGGVAYEGERQAINFNPNVTMESDAKKKRVSVRTLFGKDEAVYVMDAKVTGNLGRYFNHSCSPNLFVQNVFVDSHDIRFPWVAFFALTHIRAGTELTWNYNYEVGVVPGKVLYCQCGASNCRQRLL